MRRHSFLLKSRNGPRGLGAGAGAGRDDSETTFDRLFERLFLVRLASDAMASLELRLLDVDLEAQVPSSVVAQDSTKEETTAKPSNFSHTNSYILMVKTVQLANVVLCPLGHINLQLSRAHWPKTPSHKW